jgi:hypothetical protein
LSEIVSGRQLRAARVLAGLSQAQLARLTSFHVRSCRYWESRGDDPPSSIPKTLRTIERALLARGVIVFSKPTPGARLADEAEYLSLSDNSGV